MRDRSRSERRAEIAVMAAFGLAVLGAAGAVAAYFLLEDETQAQGITLGGAFIALAAGLGLWARRLEDEPEDTEVRHDLPRDRRLAPVAEGNGIGRRTLLVRGLLGAVGAMTAALAVPFLSLGPSPGRSLFVTSWRSGSRLVGSTGEPVQATDVPVDGVVTVFPEGHVGDADAQALLLHLDLGRLGTGSTAALAAGDGFVAFSKVCTHAGCPVGLFRAVQGVVICPCHQSTFDVYEGAVPTFGPAARALPALPISQAEDGTFTAQGDFDAPVGPSFWNMSQ